MKGAKTNLAASVHQRLLNLARASNRPFNELLQYFAIERFLYRFSLSPYKEQFILKGAQMLRAWESPLARPTMDIACSWDRRPTQSRISNASSASNVSVSN